MCQGKDGCFENRCGGVKVPLWASQFLHPLPGDDLRFVHSLKQIGRAPKGKDPSIFRCELLVSGRLTLEMAFRKDRKKGIVQRFNDELS